MPIPLKAGMNYNYNGTGSSPTPDITYLRNLGFTKIRLLVVRYTSTVTLATWRNLALTALNLGYTKVIYGLTFGAGTSLNSSAQASYLAAIQAEATWAQSVGKSALELQVGNEEELHHDATMTDASVRAFMRACAAVAKATYTAGPISYSSSVAAGTEITDWKAEGVGALDRIGFNLYGSDFIFKSNAVAVVSNFGAVGFVSEWGTNNGYIDVNNEEIYKKMLINRQAVLENAGVADYYFYNFMNADNTSWGVKLTTNSFRSVWPHFISQRAWYKDMPNVALTRANVNGRSASAVRPSVAGRSYV